MEPVAKNYFLSRCPHPMGMKVRVATKEEYEAELHEMFERIISERGMGHEALVAYREKYSDFWARTKVVMGPDGPLFLYL